MHSAVKRKLDEGDPGPCAKRTLRNVCQLQDGDEGDDPVDPDLLDDDGSSTCLGADSPGADTALPTETASTPATTTTTAAAGSASSPRRRKFPSDLKTIRCPTCPKTFNRPARLAAHLRSHTNDRPFKCPFAGCAKDYLEEKHLKQHVKGSHTRDQRYACEEPGCGRAFVTATRLRRHAAVHEGAERFRCRGFTGCAQSFRKHQTLQRHVRTEHLGLPAFSCTHDACPAGFDSAGALRRHVEREHGELRFWCDECCGEEGGEGQGGLDRDRYGGKTGGFTTMALLRAHMRREHVGCMFCDARCGTQGQLERHIETCHSGTGAGTATTTAPAAVRCPWEGCPKTFTRRNNLNAHVRTAHEGFRFVCGRVDTFATEDLADWNWTEEGCGEGFVSKMKLEEHVRFVHLGRRRPPRVHVLGEGPPDGGAATGGDDLIESLAGVTDEAKRNIPCPTDGCGVRFIRHHDLGIHMRRAHAQHANDGPVGDHESTRERPPGLDNVAYPSLVEVPGEIPVRLPENPPGEEGAQEQEHFWFSAAEGGDEQGRSEFEREWADMRRLIDVDALTDGQGV